MLVTQVSLLPEHGMTAKVRLPFRRLAAVALLTAILGAVTDANAQPGENKKARDLPRQRAQAALENLKRREWTVDGFDREGLLHVPSNAKNSPTPVVFVFHGHGGTMQHAAT